MKVDKNYFEPIHYHFASIISSIRAPAFFSNYFHFIVGMVGTIWLFVFLIFASFIPFSMQDEHRLNYGVMFQKQIDVDFASDTWVHTFEIPLFLDVTLPELSKCTLRNPKYCFTLHQLSVNIKVIRTKLKSHLDSAKQLVYALIPEIKMPLKSRSKRALLPFVGELSKSLFGVATSNDVNVLAQHINQLTKNNNKVAKALKRYGGDFSSFVTHIDERLSNAMKGMKAESVTINRMITELKQVESELPAITSIFTGYLMRHLNDAFLLETFLTNLRASLSDLAEGKLSPWIISPELLINTTTEIQTILDQDKLGYKIVTTDPAYYYKFAKFTMMRNTSVLYLSVQFPLATYKNSFSTYKVLSFPVPINNSQNHASQLLDLHDYLLLSTDNQFYATISDKTMSQCQRTEKVVHCFQKPNLFSINTTENCLLNLFQGNPTLIKEACDFRFLTNKLKPHLIQISDTELLVYQTPSLTMQCQSKLSELDGCNFCILNIPCHCTVLTETNKFLPHVASCDSTMQNVTTLHPVNLALLQHFFSEDTIATIMANTTFKNVVDVKVPNFKLYKHKMQDVLANDKVIDLSLKQVIKRTEEDNKIYSNLAESLINGEIQLENPWPTLNDILTYIAFGLTIFNTIWLIFLFCKFKTLATALLLTKSTSASPTFYFTQPTTTIETNTLWDVLLKDQVQWDHFAITLLLINLLLLAVIVKKIFGRRNIHTNVYLEITNGKACVTVKALSVPLCLSHWHVQPPAMIDNIIVLGSFRPKLAVNWPKFAFTSKLTSTSLQVPGLISISYYQAYRLRKILKESYCAYIVMAHKNIYYPLKTNNLPKPPSVPTHDHMYPNVFE